MIAEFPHPYLFTPVRIGPIALKHRIVMAPLTRSRSVQPGDIPGALMLEYYTAASVRRRPHCLRENLRSRSRAADGLEHPVYIRTNRSTDGGISLPPSMRKAAACSRSCGIPDAPRASRWRVATCRFRLPLIRPTGRMPRTLFRGPVAGSSPHRIGPWILRRSWASSRTIVRLPAGEGCRLRTG